MSAIVAYGAIDALGEGEAAFGLAPHASAVTRDPELSAAGLLRPFCARANIEVRAGGDRATALLEKALDACLLDLGRVMPDFRSRRVGLAIGTSSGGMRGFEADGGIAGTYLGAVLALQRPLAFEPFSLVLGACASGTLAIGVARAWLEQGKCDVALAGGFDAVSVFVAAGFEALRAVCTERPRPFRVGRDGLALGEGAAVLAMVRAEDAPARARAWVSGFGASCDAVHLTAPDRTGGGLARAAEAALVDASHHGCRAPVELVSAHATATDYNDAAEAKAIAAALPGLSPPVHALKGAIGHTLGAAGALEALAAVEAMRASVAPMSCGAGTIEGDVRVLDQPELHQAAVALKLSAAFGGANAALVLAREAPVGGQDRAPRPVYVSRAVALASAPSAATLASRTGYPEDKIARADGLVHLTMGAVARLADQQGDLATAGIVVGHGLATIETNRLFLARLRASGAHRGEPRRFPYTTPNAAAGECAVAFGLTGPAFAVGGGPHGGLEALMVAADLVATGAAERIVVVAVDEAGEGTRAIAPETPSGTVAVLVSAAPSAARIDAVTVRLEPGPLAAPRAMAGHTALLPLAEPGKRPESLSVDLPWGGFANASFFWL